MDENYRQWEQDQQDKRSAFHAKEAEVEALKETAAGIQVTDEELATLPVSVQKIYSLLKWLIEARRLDEMDRGAIPFDIG
jgi:hypothetical protein